ncbi:MAG: hypothetical protein CMH31_02830 [Micavibrio sp.]|nr:hypothetical protein [Micavibrio sp.]
MKAIVLVNDNIITDQNALSVMTQMGIEEILIVKTTLSISFILLKPFLMEASIIRKLKIQTVPFIQAPGPALSEI